MSPTTTSVILSGRRYRFGGLPDLLGRDGVDALDVLRQVVVAEAVQIHERELADDAGA